MRKRTHRELTDEEVFCRWTEAAGPWDQWLKPSLFAQAPDELQPRALESRDVTWLGAEPNTALILDVHGIEAVELGVALAASGSCLVPLFNTSPGVNEAVDARGLTAALKAAAATLRRKSEGRPVFLLDADRQTLNIRWTELTYADGSNPFFVAGRPYFENRWFVFASDLPTEKTLRARGIERLVVVSRTPLLADLRDALAGHSGLGLTWMDPDSKAAVPFPKGRPRVVRALSTVGRFFNKNLDGTFGHPISQG